MIDRRPAFRILGPCKCPGHRCVFVETSVSSSRPADYQEVADGLADFVSKVRPTEIEPMGEFKTIDVATRRVLGTRGRLRMELSMSSDRSKRCDNSDPLNRRN